MAEDVYLDVRVQPRSSREGVGERVAGRYRVRVHAAPVGNAANRELEALLAREFGVAKSLVEVVAGHTRRDKRVRVRAPARRPGWLDANAG